MKSKIFLYVFFALVATYICLALGLPSDPAVLHRFHLSQGQVHLLSLTIIIPIILVWAYAFYGFWRFKIYAHMVRRSKEGKPFNSLADGLMILIIGLIASGIVSSLLNYMAVHNPQLLPTATIIKNYVAVALPLIGFLYIAKGADGLLKTLRSRMTLPLPPFGPLALIVTACLFSGLIVARNSQAAQHLYYLPNWLLVLTLAIPYVFMWYKGALAAYRLYKYKTEVKGIIYQRAVSDLYLGIAFIIGISIMLQVLTTFAERLNRLHLTPLLAFLYLLVFLFVVGYGLVARSAKKFKRIEEV